MPAVEVTLAFDSMVAYVRRAHGSPRELTADEDDLLWEFGDNVVTHVQDLWPADTSTSRDLWSFYTVSTASEIAVVIENPMDYATYVHPAGTEPGEWYYIEAITAARDLYKEPFLAALKAEIDSTEKRITANRSRGGRGFLDLVAGTVRRVA